MGRIGQVGSMSEHRPTNDDRGPENSLPERVGREHRRLHDLVVDARAALKGSGDADRALEELSDATQAHFLREESLYYPTLWALRGELEAPLGGLISEHEDFRARLREIRRAQAGGDARAAIEQLESFVERLSVHESAEERVLASLASGAS
jgi:hemerythrin